MINKEGKKRRNQSTNDGLCNLIDEQFRTCNGNAVRVLENLRDGHGVAIPYSTLTQRIRDMGLRQGKKRRRSGEFKYGPGKEMQHDTSPHKPVVAGRPEHAQCAGMALGYSRKLYAQYYPSFTRLEARHFLTESLEFIDGICELCVIDNTSVIVAHGSGANAVMAPEMESFGKYFDFRFMAHEIGHADRKAIMERNFSYIEGNFLAGRNFESWTDLNQQARRWCIEVANKKSKRSLAGMSPEQVYLMEKKYIGPLPAYIPPVYQILHRVVDIYGYVHVDCNRYSVPERLVGKQVEVHLSVHRIEIFFENRKVGFHQRCVGRRDAKIKTAGHHTLPVGGKNRKGPSKEEKILVGTSPWLACYVAELKKRSRGRAVRKMRHLLSIKRTYPKEAFKKAINQAANYGLYDLNRLERLIISFVAGDFFNIREDE